MTATEARPAYPPRKVLFTIGGFPATCPDRRAASSTK